AIRHGAHRAVRQDVTHAIDIERNRPAGTVVASEYRDGSRHLDVADRAAVVRNGDGVVERRGTAAVDDPSPIDVLLDRPRERVLVRSTGVLDDRGGTSGRRDLGLDLEGVVLAGARSDRIPGTQGTDRHDVDATRIRRVVVRHQPNLVAVEVVRP